MAGLARSPSVLTEHIASKYIYIYTYRISSNLYISDSVSLASLARQLYTNILWMFDVCVNGGYQVLPLPFPSPSPPPSSPPPPPPPLLPSRLEPGNKVTGTGCLIIACTSKAMEGNSLFIHLTLEDGTVSFLLAVTWCLSAAVGGIFLQVVPQPDEGEL